VPSQQMGQVWYVVEAAAMQQVTTAVE